MLSGGIPKEVGRGTWLRKETAPRVEALFGHSAQECRKSDSLELYSESSTTHPSQTEWYWTVSIGGTYEKGIPAGNWPDDLRRSTSVTLEALRATRVRVPARPFVRWVGKNGSSVCGGNGFGDDLGGADTAYAHLLAARFGPPTRRSSVRQLEGWGSWI